MSTINSAEIEIRKKISQNPLFSVPAPDKTDKDFLLLLFGQYIRTLQYFPAFLAKCINVLPSIEQKTFISQILYQELGESDPSKAHEIAFFQAMQEIGLSQPELLSTPLMKETAELMDLYHSSTDEIETALGVLFATEVGDLAIILGLYKVMGSALTIKTAPLWVELHVKQEPDHVKASVKALIESEKNVNFKKVTETAHECTHRWTQLFTVISQLQHFDKKPSKMETASV